MAHSTRDHSEAGWFWLDNELIDTFGPRLGAYGVAVYAVLCRHAWNGSQEIVNVSQRDIATSLAISQDRVRKSLTALAEAGLIEFDSGRVRPGMIPKITLLRIKTGERHTFTRGQQVNATRSANKERKTKTKTIEERPRRDSGAPAFEAPTLEQITAYCHERGNEINPQSFLAYYNASGWRIGGSPMANWKAAVERWEINGYNNGKKHANKAEQRQSDNLQAAARAKLAIMGSR